jgi:hypothetical protein
MMTASNQLDSLLCAFDAPLREIFLVIAIKRSQLTSQQLREWQSAVFLSKR